MKIFLENCVFITFCHENDCHVYWNFLNRTGSSVAFVLIWCLWHKLLNMLIDSYPYFLSELEAGDWLYNCNLLKLPSHFEFFALGGCQQSKACWKIAGILQTLAKAVWIQSSIIPSQCANHSAIQLCYSWTCNITHTPNPTLYILAVTSFTLQERSQ